MEVRTCPECGAERPETGGAFCSSYCTHMYFHGKSEEFEVDLSIHLEALKGVQGWQRNLNII